MNKKRHFMMKTALALFMVLCSVWGWGQILLTEDFNYSTSSTLTANGWSAHSGGGTAPIDVTAGLNFAGYAGSGIGGAANIDNTGEDVNRTFTAQSGTVYVAFMLQTSTPNSAGYFLNLGPDPMGSTFVARLYVNAAGTGIGISETSTAPTSFASITPSATALVVIKRTASQTSLYVFSSLPTLEPVTPAMSYSTTNSAVASIGLRQYNASQRQIVDGIRIAKNWSDIFPSAAGPTVTTSPATTISTSGATINGSINANGVDTGASFDYGTSTAYGNTVTASPATATGSTATSISAELSGLSINTQYNYRAVGTGGTPPVYGANVAFWTLANTPAAVTVSNPTLTTLDVVLNATDGNPAGTQYAINESTTGKYVQADGTLAATPVWQTIATWGTKTVTGLTVATSYTFQTKARNGADVETTFGNTASDTTSTPDAVDYNVVQWPNTAQSINEGTDFTVYVQAYEPGVTETAGASPRINAWVGYSATNDNPANGGWTWVPAVFNIQTGNNDEYQANIPTAVPGTYYYAARFEMDNSGAYTYGGSGGNWNDDNVQLNVLADVVDFANIQSPSTANIFSGNTVTVYAQVYEPGITDSAGQGAGITAEIGYSSTNGTPDATWTWIPATYNVDFGNNDEYIADLGAGLPVGTYYYASRFKKSTGSKYVYGGTAGVWNNDSGVLTVSNLGIPTATAATNVAPTSFTANWEAFTGAEAYILEVNKVSGSVTPDVTVVGWNFVDENITADLGIALNAEKIISTNGGTITYSAGASGQAATASSWAAGAGNKSWLISFSTNGISNLKISSKQRSSNTGPRDFKVQYSLDNSNWTDVPSGAVTVANDFTTGVLSDITLPTALNDQTVAYLRWVMTSNSSVSNSTVTTGTSRIDDLVITGDQGSFISTPVAGSPFTVTAPATSYNITGLDPNTKYTYTVKAVNGSVTSGASNTIEVITQGVPTWNGTAWSNTTGPDASTPAVIAADYSGPAFAAQSLTVNAGKTLNVTDYVTTDDVTNNGHIIVADGGNFVQTGTFTAGADSSFKVRKSTKAVKRLAYVNWSSPMNNSAQTLKQFSYGKKTDGTNQSGTGTVDNRFFTYNNNAFVSILPGSTFNPAGAGFLIRTPNDFTTTGQVFNGQFEGTTPNSGTISYDHSGIGGDYVMLGNPYPSAISLDDFLTANPGTTETVYIWNSQAEMDANNQYTGTNYNTYAPGTGSVPAGSIDGYIPVGQAFFVERATIPTTTPFVFTDALRQTTADGVFSRGATADKFWLELTSPSGSKPQMLIGFNAAATAGFDAGFDATLIGSNADALYSTVDSRKLVIDAHGSFTSDDSFVLNADVSAAGSYTIGVLKTEGVFANGQQIWLKDQVTGSVTLISEQPYTFTAEAGTVADRFTLQFKPGGALATDAAVKAGITIFSSGSEIHARAAEHISSVEVYEMSGKLIANARTSQKEITMHVPYKGVVLVKVALQNGTVQTKKLMLK